jgi:hypothetical protein
LVSQLNWNLKINFALQQYPCSYFSPNYFSYKTTMFTFRKKSRLKRPNNWKSQVPVQRVMSELPIAIQDMCCRIKHPALRWKVSSAFEISAASVSSSTVHFIHTSVVDTNVSVTFPAASGRAQF